MVCALRTSQDPERMDLVRENQLRGCPSISLQRTWKIWQPNWGCRPDRLNTFRFERKVLSCQSGTSQAASRRAILWAVELATSYVWTAGVPSASLVSSRRTSGSLDGCRLLQGGRKMVKKVFFSALLLIMAVL